MSQQKPSGTAKSLPARRYWLMLPIAVLFAVACIGLWTSDRVQQNRNQLYGDDQHTDKLTTDQRIADLTGDLAYYTKLLFYATAGLALITAGLLIFGFFQLRDSRKSTVAAENAAKAASDSAGTAAKQFEISHRPWIPPNPQISGNLISDDDGIKMPITVTMRNTGNSPAFNVTVQCEISIILANPPEDDSNDKQLQLADALREIVKERKNRGLIGNTLFPTEIAHTPTVLTLPSKLVQKALKARPIYPFILPVIYGTIIYESILGNIYETGFVFMVNKARVNTVPGGPPIAYYGITPSEGNVPARELALVRHPGASGRTT